MVNKTTFAFAFCFVILLFSVAISQVPQLINYQGILSDANGIALSGNYSIEFRIYNSATDGSALWTETQTVTAADGLFDVILGSVTPIPFSVFDGKDKYLSLKIGSDSEMTPRKQLVSVGYSLRAYDADKVDGKHASDFVQQVDGVLPNNSGNVDLVAGDNVTITPDVVNKKITISAAPGGGGDNLGNHIATQNIKLNGHWMSGDGRDDGIFVSNSGNVGIGDSNPEYKLNVNGGVKIKDGVLGINNTLSSGPALSIVTKNNGANLWIETQGPPLLPTTLTLFNNISNQAWAIGTGEGGVGGNKFFIADYTYPLTTPFVIDTSGRIGIGKTNPTQKLDVAGLIQMLGFKMPTGAEDGYILTSNADGIGSWKPSSGGADNLGNHTATQNIKLNGHWISYDGGNKGIYISNYGRVGIGKTNPGSSLGVEGMVEADELYAQQNIVAEKGFISVGQTFVPENGTINCQNDLIAGDDVIANGIVQTNGFKMPTGAANGHILTTDENGIGTWQPLNGGVGNDWTISGNNIYSTVSGNVGIGLNNPVGKLDVSHNGTEHDFIIDGVGRVGVGAVPPVVSYSKFMVATSDYEGGLFHINNTNNSFDALRCITNGSGNALSVRTDGNGNAVKVNHNGSLGNIAEFQSNNETKVVIDKTGKLHAKSLEASDGDDKVTINNYSIKLSEGSNRYLAFESLGGQLIMATNDLRIYYGHTFGAGGLVFFETGTERMRIHPGGNVGIGAPSPGNILTVQSNSPTDPIADAWTVYSSRRWKTDIKPINHAMEMVKRLTGVFYNWKTDGKHDIGLIAEDVGEVIPEVVAYEKNGVDAKSVDYARLVAVLIQGMKEQQDTIAKLEQRIKALEKK